MASHDFSDGVASDGILSIGGAATLSSTLIVGGAATLSSTLSAQGADVIRRSVTTIAAADVKTLNATAVEIVPAPAAGYFIDVISVHWFLDFATAAYDAAAAGDTLVARYTDAAGAIATDAVAGDTIGAAAADYHVTVRPIIECIPVTDAALVAHITTGEWFAAAGDSPLKVEVLYRVRPFAFA